MKAKILLATMPIALVGWLVSAAAQQGLTLSNPGGPPTANYDSSPTVVFFRASSGITSFEGDFFVPDGIVLDQNLEAVDPTSDWIVYGPQRVSSSTNQWRVLGVLPAGVAREDVELKLGFIPTRNSIEAPIYVAIVARNDDQGTSAQLGFTFDFTPTRTIGDLNGDGVLDGLDLSLVASAALNALQPSGARALMDVAPADGVLNGSDVRAFISALPTSFRQAWPVFIADTPNNIRVELSGGSLLATNNVSSFEELDASTGSILRRIASTNPNSKYRDVVEEGPQSILLVDNASTAEGIVTYVEDQNGNLQRGSFLPHMGPMSAVAGRLTPGGELIASASGGLVDVAGGGAAVSQNGSGAFVDDAVTTDAGDLLYVDQDLMRLQSGGNGYLVVSADTGARFRGVDLLTASTAIIIDDDGQVLLIDISDPTPSGGRELSRTRIQLPTGGFSGFAARRVAPGQVELYLGSTSAATEATVYRYLLDL